MTELLQKCSVCTTSFHVQFSYQMEEVKQTLPLDTGDATRPQGGFRFFCSQDCVKRSHSSAQSGLVPCGACGTAFTLTQAAQVFFLKGKRNYACQDACRTQLMAEARGLRLGEMSQAATASVPSSAHSQPAGPRVLAVFNHKGGTGKTTTAVTVAAGLAEQGQRTLLVDSDAQGNVAVSLGIKSQRSLYHVLVMGLKLAQAAQEVRPNLDVLPSNETLAAAELYLAGRKNRDRVLATRLAEARDNYDYVIVDCSPSLSLLNQNALVFADAVLCPVACDYLSLVGVRQVVKTIKNVNRLLGHPVQLWGVLPTLYDQRAKICREALETLQEHFGPRCLEPIRSAIRVKEAPSQAKTLFEYAGESKAATDYRLVVERLLREGQQQYFPTAAKAVSA